jgi:hypothetical protein
MGFIASKLPVPCALLHGWFRVQVPGLPTMRCAACMKGVGLNDVTVSNRVNLVDTAYSGSARHFDPPTQ